ncbi:MAG: CRTAC1 family protein [Gammaproteobacteria bacterium]|nr:CRTAC1 family protein [Gammaproteobacteria bacterium]
MRFDFFKLLTIAAHALCCLFSATQLSAQTLTTADRSLISQICSGQSPQLPVLTARKKLLVSNTGGETHSAHTLLPLSISANSLNQTGAIACVSIQEIEIESCDFGPFFSDITRIRQDYLINVHSVEFDIDNVLSALIEGDLPPACADAGTIDSSVTSIKGAKPADSDIITALENLELNAEDPDGDGYSNLEEFVQGTGMHDASDPGMEILVSANHSNDLVIPEGEAITLYISLNPGEYKKKSTDYYLYADSLGGLFSFIYPKKFDPVETRQVSARGPALRFNDFPIITLPALGIGEYEIVFEVEIDGQEPIRNTANISVVSNEWQFTEATLSAGFDYSHGFEESNSGSAHDRRTNSAGVAAGDYDGDGWVDLYVIRGTTGANLLFRNLKNGTFEEVGAAAGVNLTGLENSSATFADFDGDGWLDLIVTGMNGTQVTLFKNDGDSTFTDITSSSGLTEMSLSYGVSFADYDKDGDLDFWINHWLFAAEGSYLWRNNADGTFTDVTDQAGIPLDTTADFTTNFADINNDSWLDLLVSGDYGSSQVFTSNQDGTFELVTSAVITDENGMGGAVGDYDNDGDLDWFVTSIYDFRTGIEFPWGITGNRFYQNDGHGNFTDVTDETGTRIGYWGWGACFADFNNDGWLDLFHVNGYSGGGDASISPFLEDPSQLFVSDKAGSFMERSSELGLIDTSQGRGVVCFDYDRDGDVDLFISNNRQPPALYRNDGGNNNNYLHIQLEGEDQNSEAVGARIYLSDNGMTQMRELRAGSNYLSQNPVEAYFGLGTETRVDQVRVVWPSGVEKILEDIEANQLLFITHPNN